MNIREQIFQEFAKHTKKNPELVSKLLETTYKDGKRPNSAALEYIISSKAEEQNFYLDLLNMKDSNGKRFSVEDIFYVYKKQQESPEYIDKILNLRNFSGEYSCSNTQIKKLANIIDPKQQKFAIDAISQGVSPEKVLNLHQSPYLDEISMLIKEGVRVQEIENALKGDYFEEFMKKAVEKTSPLKEFFASPDYMKQIKDNSAGKYQKELMEFFDIEKMPYDLKTNLYNSNLSVEDFLSSLKKISKSSFKLTYDTPNQYIDGLSTNLSTPINGHYPKLSEEELSLQRQKVKRFYTENMVSLMRILKYADNDTVNHLMDKRFSIFSEELIVMDKASDKLMDLYSKLLKCKSEATGKQLTVKEKMQLTGIIKVFSIAKFDTLPLEKALEEGTINFNKLRDFIYNEILKIAGANVNIKDLLENKKFNEEYAYLLLNPSFEDTMTQNERDTYEATAAELVNELKTDPNELNTFIKNTQEVLESGSITSPKTVALMKKFLNALQNIDNYTVLELQNLYKKTLFASFGSAKGADNIHTLVREATLNDFREFFNSPENKFGQANLKTKKIFEEKGLNYNQWIDPDISDIKFSVGDKNLTIRMWERNPQEDLFMGNKTSCCTAIGRTNGGATPVYIMSSCWNVVQMFNNKGDVVGMSRIFIGEKDGECSVMMDNIELNNKLTKNMSSQEKTIIRNNFFKYMHKLAEKVTNNPDAKVYFYRGDTHVPTYDLEDLDTYINFIGENPTEEVYINSYDLRWGNPKEFEKYRSRWYEVPKN